MTELPSGTVTFLFTDLEGSTRLWEEQPEAMRAALARHDTILREAIESNRGVVFSEMGDGMAAAFASAGDGVAAGFEAQLGLEACEWGPIGPLRARIGLHAGEGELRADGQYANQPLNRCARLMAVANGGQVVVSETVESLVRGALPPEVGLVDLGEHRLRDLARPMGVFQLTHPGLPREFPRLRSVDAFGGNLPVQVTSFVGREDEWARVLGLLGKASLVTLVGTGGVGKTRLAIQVAAEVVPRFGDGAWFCELAAVDDGEAMAQVVASTLGCVQRPGLSLAESIVEYVKVRELLVVLDNCEHLLDEAGALVEGILRNCPRVKVLATSREALDVTGERVVRVRSLDAPGPTAQAEEVVSSAAVRLFADRAADAGADTTWSDGQWAAVGEICRRVDGIPLAIELAAARVASMSPTDIAAHLDERFRLLTGKRRGRVERHQTLRATVEWSYQLLEKDEQVVFDRFGVFAGTFDAAAAGAVASDEDLDGWEVTDAISSLVAKSMLGTDDGPDDTSRYSMLETLRQFARERLDETGDADRWRHRHAEYCAKFAHSAGFGITSADEVLWVARLYAELDNVRAAVGWALDREEPAERELGVQIVAALSDAGHSHPNTGISALAAQAEAAAEACRPELRAPVLAQAAYYEVNQGRSGRARTLARAALRDGIVATSTNPISPHWTLIYLDSVTGSYGGALEIENEARTALETIDNPYAQSTLLMSLASFEAMAGQVDRSRADAQRALALARRSQNPSALARAFSATAWSLQRDDPAAALTAVEHYLEIYRGAIDLASGAGQLLALAGGLRARTGDPVGALELLHEAVIITRDQGARPQLASALDWGLSPLLKLGRADPAATFVGALTGGPLAEVANFPLVDPARARILERVRAVLGDETTNESVARGAAMSYDTIVEYALDHLEPPAQPLD